MKEQPKTRSWTWGMSGPTPPRHLIHSHLKQQNEERLQEMAADGVTEVQIVCGTDHDCAVCIELDGQIFPIDEAPELPPPKCSCVPHCTCILTAITGQ